MIGLIVAIVVMALVVGAVYASKAVKHPEQTASHDESDTMTTSERFYETADRPAGPDVDDFVTPDEQAEADGGIRSAGAPEEEHGRGPT